eukprot:8888651-Ditylum_brightwellii.AAC.1
MEEDNTITALPTAIVPETIPELECEVEQLLAASTTTGEQVAETATLIGEEGTSAKATCPAVMKTLVRKDMC